MSTQAKFEQAKFETALVDRLQASVGDWVERATKAEGGERSRLLPWLLAALAVFLAWRMERGLKKLFWTLFWIGMSLYWSGGYALFWR